MSATGERPRRGLELVPIAFLTALYVIPLVAVAVAGLRSGGPGGIAAEILSGSTLRLLGYTLWQAALSVAATLLVAAPITWALARYRFPGRDLMRSMTLVPFVFPTVVAGLVFLSIFGPRSPWVDLTGTTAALVLAHVFLNIAVFVRMIGPRLRGGRRDLEDAAAVLGAPPRRVFAEITWPGIRPTLMAASLMAFMFCFTTLGVVQVLGAGRIRTLETAIYRATLFDLDLTRAAALAIVQLLVLLALVGLLLKVEGVESVPESEDAARPVSTTVQRLILGLAAALFVVWVILPLVLLMISSLRVGGGWSTAGWVALFTETGSTAYVSPLGAVWRSLSAAAMATCIALPMGAITAVALTGQSRILRALVLLPLGTSAATLGLGLLLAFGRPPIALTDTWILVPMAQALVSLPFVVRILAPAIRTFDRRLLDVAAVLGASPRRAVLRVMLPALRPSLVAAASFAFAISMGEFGATAFVARSTDPTLPLAIVRLLGRPGELNLTQAYAASVLLLGIVLVLVLIADRADAKERL